FVNWRPSVLPDPNIYYRTVFLMQYYSGDECINIGCGEDMPIKELANLIKEVVGYKGEIAYDTSMPDGTPRKLLDSSKLLALGWSPKISLSEGLASTYEDYKKNHMNYRN
ncbi:MAG: hypothetical protein LUH04_19780, partial [Clostridium sp.]|nr:hypothetical protein [Clostridium sp.]